MPTSSDRIGAVILRVLVAGVLLALVIVLGQIPWGKSRDEAILRLALRTVRGKMEICRSLDESELSNLPAHMRGSGEVCESVPATYRLRVAVDGRELIDQLVEPGGLRRDRPHNVDREWVFRPGSASLEISFTPEAPADPTPEVSEALADLPSYELTREVRFTADRITLVFLNDSTGALDVEGG
jgi:hypothetical protein